MNKTLTTIVGIGKEFLGVAGLTAALWSGAKFADYAFEHHKQFMPVEANSYLPSVGKNQQLMIDPKMLNGMSPVEYLLLTDKDYNGTWDFAEQVHTGWTTGDGYRKVYFTPGNGPAQSIAGTPWENAEFIQVNQDFFAAYESLSMIGAKKN